jgi:hypothetical protein
MSRAIKGSPCTFVVSTASDNRREVRVADSSKGSDETLSVPTKFSLNSVKVLDLQIPSMALVTKMGYALFLAFIPFEFSILFAGHDARMSLSI